MANSQLYKGITIEKNFVPGSPLVPTAEAIYIIPSLLVREGDLVRRETNDIAIPFVQFALPAYQLAGHETVNERQSRRSPKLGPGNSSSKRMKEEIVDCTYKTILGRVSKAGGRGNREIGEEGEVRVRTELTAKKTNTGRKI